MLEILQKDEWVSKIETIRPLKFNEQSKVVNSIARIYNCMPCYFLYVSKGQVVASLVAYTVNEKIIEPIHFFYSALWIAPMSDLKYIENMSDFVKSLTNRFSSITLRIPVVYQDIRPFLWNNFSVANHYTYIKKLADELSYSQSVTRNLNQFKTSRYRFEQTILDAKSLRLNIEIFEKLHAMPFKIKKIAKLLLALNDIGVLSCFNAYDGDQLQTSMLVMLDNEQKEAYLILLNQTETAKKLNVHTKLHQFAFETLKETGYHQLDLMGGDMKGISAYKSSLKTDLHPHFIVKYDRKKANFTEMVNLTKLHLKKTLRKFN